MFPSSSGKIVLTTDVVKSLVATKSPRLTFSDKTDGRSIVWQTFHQVSVDGTITSFVKCKNCAQVYYHGPKTGTSHLSKHSCGKSPQKTNQGVNTIQMNLSSICARVVPEKAVKKINDVIVVGLAQDLRPLRTVEGCGFKKIAQELVNFGATYGKQQVESFIKNRTSLRRYHLENVVQDHKNQMKTDLGNAPSLPTFSFTLDMWADKYKSRDYLSLTTHYFNKDWELLSPMLDIQEFAGDVKSTENLIKVVKSMMLPYFGDKVDEIMSKSYSVTDGGSNMIKIFPTRFPCQCHKLNLCVQWTLNETALTEKSSKNSKLDKKKCLLYKLIVLYLNHAWRM